MKSTIFIFLAIFFTACAEESIKSAESKTSSKVEKVKILHEPTKLSNSMLIEDLDKVINKVDVTKKEKSVASFVKKIAEKYTISYQIKKGEREFYFSKPLCTNERAYVIGFTKLINGDESVCDLEPKTWVARVFYRSNSNGGWRFTKGYNEGIYEKGSHYTQSSRPQEFLNDFLQSKDMDNCTSITEDPVKSDFVFTYLQNENDIKTMKDDHLIGNSCSVVKQKIVNTNLGWFFGGTLRNGYGLYDKKDTFVTEASAKDFVAGFFPTNFSKPKYTYNTSHTLLSPRSEPSNPLNISFKKDIIVKVFIGKLNEREVEWHFAYQEGTKNPWVHLVRFSDTKTNSYGGDDEVIDTGSITMKPVEYALQLKNIPWTDSKEETIKVWGEFKRINTEKTLYIDIRNWLSKWPLMKPFINTL